MKVDSDADDKLCHKAILCTYCAPGLMTVTNEEQLYCPFKQWSSCTDRGSDAQEVGSMAFAGSRGLSCL